MEDFEKREVYKVKLIIFSVVAGEKPKKKAFFSSYLNRNGL